MPGLSGLRGLRGLSGIMGIHYLLRDEFWTDLAAGAVNGTEAEPGPGTRVVTDTGNNLSISGGNAVWAGVAGNGDPGLWYGAITRTSGRVLVASATASAATGPAIGFDSNQATYMFGGSGIDTTGAGNAFRALDDFLAIDTRVAGTTYQFGIVLRSSGSYSFIKGGTFTEWTLLWVSALDSTATLYPNINTFDGTFSANYIRIPDRLWLPTPLAYDTFTRANGALGDTETTGPDGQATTARAWTNQVGTTLVAGNAASASALVGGIAIATVDTGETNLVFSSTLTRSGNEIGIVLRYADSNNYIRAYHDGTNAKLDKIVGGAPTGVISAAQAYAAGAAIVVIADGTSFSLYYNNVKIGATSTIGDAALQTGTEQGTYSTNTGNSQDLFQAFPRGTNNEYNRLDSF